MPPVKYLLIPYIGSLLHVVPPHVWVQVPSNAHVPQAIYAHRLPSVPPHKSHALGQHIPKAAWHRFPMHYDPALSFVALQHRSQRSTVPTAPSPIEAIIPYSAQDPIVFDAENSIFHLYGAVGIDYADMRLAAEHVALDWSTHTLEATGKYDAAGNLVQKPVFTQGNVPYVAEKMRYNLRSHRGVAHKLCTVQDEALVSCDTAKMDSEDRYYADRMIYTTCNHPQPHYCIQASRVKFLRGERIATGPFQFYFDGVPTPLGFFCGLFFIPKPKTSGFILPKLGEDAQKGFFLKSGGYYFYINDYVNLHLYASVYTQGIAHFMVVSDYKRRYSYVGKISYERTYANVAPETFPTSVMLDAWRWHWQHNTTPNNRVQSVVADVQIQSKFFNQMIDERTPGNATSTHSRVRYTHTLFDFPYVLNAGLAYEQDLPKQLMHLTLPEVSLYTSHIYPFRGQPKADAPWYQDVYLAHTFESKLRLTNQVGSAILRPWPRNWPKMLRDAQAGVRNTLPIEVNIRLFTYFNLSPRFVYRERWYFKRLDYTYDATEDKIVACDVKGFSRVWDYDVGTGLETTLYGTHVWGSERFIQAIRHRIDPKLSFRYTPDLAQPTYAYWQRVQTPQGQQLRDRYDRFIYGSVPERAHAILRFEVDNTLSLKVRNHTDPQGAPQKIPLLETLYVGTEYDFKAKQYKLGDMDLRVRTKLLNQLDVEYQATLDPYLYVPCAPQPPKQICQQKVNALAWRHRKGLGHIKQASLRVNMRFASQDSSAPPAGPAPTAPKPAADASAYADFRLPWSLQFTYHRQYAYYVLTDKRKVSHQLAFEGSMEITQCWKVNFSSTYDLGKRKLVGDVTTITLHRDMHCWQMDFDWRPLGRYASYEFSIGLKAPMLQDVKYVRSNQYEKM
ncbi:MAG: putative LPS assembly protein LptD [Bacteroidota bacterium]